MSPKRLLFAAINTQGAFMVMGAWKKVAKNVSKNHLLQ
jgi:hypothetical protein